MYRHAFTAKIWRWPGQGGWHFVTLPPEVFAELRETYGKGMVPVNIVGTNPEDRSIPPVTWEATLFPHLQSQTYILAIKKAIRQKLQTYENDTVHIELSR